MRQPDARYRRIWEVVAEIPEGSVMSYARVAELAGVPRRARFVALALRRAPDSLRLPWHRVIRADGRIAFPRGSADWERQAARLAAEGVTLPGGRIDMRRSAWRPSLDELLWRLP